MLLLLVLPVFAYSSCTVVLQHHAGSWGGSGGKEAMLTAEAFNAQQAQALAAIQATAAAHRHGDAYTVSLMQKVTQYV